MAEMRETLGNVVWRFVRVAVPGVLALGVVNALPQFVGGEPLTVVRYDSAEQLQDRLHVTVWRPAQLPQPWSWPPSGVRLATGDPDWLQFMFEPGGDGGDRLVICQTAGRERLRIRKVLPLLGWPLDGPHASDVRVPATVLPNGQLLQETDIRIHDQPARLRRLLLDAGTIVHEVWWRHGTGHIMLRLDGSGDRLLEVADSIVGRRP